MTMTVDSETRAMFESDFARLFNQENIHWHPNFEYNEMFIRVQINWINDVIDAKGHIFLNEVYDVLGFPRVPQGQLVGWFKKDGRTAIFRLTKNDDGSIMIEPNVTNSDVMYYKI